LHLLLIDNSNNSKPSHSGVTVPPRTEETQYHQACREA